MPRSPLLTLIAAVVAIVTLTGAVAPALAGPDDADGFSATRTRAVADEDGSYKIEMDENGRVRVTAEAAEGGVDTREFESLADFTHQWPELAAKFEGLGLADGGGDGASPPVEQWDEWMKRLRDRRDRHPERPERPELPNRPNRADGDGNGDRAGSGTRCLIGNNNGTFTAEVRADGSLRITAAFKGEEPETREFENQEQFEAEWPEVAKQFGEGFKLTPNGVVIRGSSSSSDSDSSGSDDSAPLPEQPDAPDQPEERKN